MVVQSALAECYCSFGLLAVEVYRKGFSPPVVYLFVNHGPRLSRTDPHCIRSRLR